jgi:hypothetical protein
MEHASVEYVLFLALTKPLAIFALLFFLIWIVEQDIPVQEMKAVHRLMNWVSWYMITASLLWHGSAYSNIPVAVAGAIVAILPLVYLLLKDRICRYFQ